MGEGSTIGTPWYMSGRKGKVGGYLETEGSAVLGVVGIFLVIYSSLVYWWHVPWIMRICVGCYK